MKTIDVAMLEKAFQRILSKLRAEKIEQIQLSYDYYKFIPTDEWANVAEDAVLVGSLVDDIDSLQKVLDDSEAVFTYVDFDRTASILRAVSETLNPVNG